VEWWHANPNCPGCGAKLRATLCCYCGRVYDKPREIKPDPARDPRLTASPRVVRY